MSERRPIDPDSKVLTEVERERLLQRASELDAARAGMRVADLRAAAAEAGISPSAFDEAVAELKVAGDLAAPPRPHGRKRTLFLGAAGGLMILLLIFGVLRMVVPVPVEQSAATTSLVEESFTLSCLSGADAAELLRPILLESQATIVQARQGSRVIRVRGTATDVVRIRDFLTSKDAERPCPLPPSTRR